MGVASDLGKEFADLAVELIDSDEHERASIKGPASFTGDAADPQTVPPTPTSIRVFEDKYSHYFERNKQNGVSRLLYMSTQSGFEPDAGHHVKLDRETRWEKVIKVDRFGAGGVDSLFVLHCGAM